MNNINIYELLRMVLLGGFAGFAIFSVSYGLVVWGRRNKGAGSGKHALATIGAVLAAVGIAGLLSGVVQAKLGQVDALINTLEID